MVLIVLVWEIESIDSKRTTIVVKKGDSKLQFYAMFSAPLSWADGDQVYEPEGKGKGSSDILFMLKNKTKGGQVDAHLTGKSGVFAKSFNQGESESEEEYTDLNKKKGIKYIDGSDGSLVWLNDDSKWVATALTGSWAIDDVLVVTKAAEKSKANLYTWTMDKTGHTVLAKFMGYEEPPSPF